MNRPRSGRGSALTVDLRRGEGGAARSDQALRVLRLEAGVLRHSRQQRRVRVYGAPRVLRCFGNRGGGVGELLHLSEPSFVCDVAMVER